MKTEGWSSRARNALFWSVGIGMFLLCAGACLALALRQDAGMSRLLCLLPALCCLLLLLALVWLTGRQRQAMRGVAAVLHDAEADVSQLPAGARLVSDGEYRALLAEIHSRAGENMASRMLKTEAELHALQNQISPHFLYNTLEVIRGRALLQGANDVSEMTEALATLFRYNINSPGELTTLENELDNIQNYLLIQRYRFVDRFVYRQRIEDEADDVLKHLLPVLTLQPIVENALFHGLDDTRHDGLLTLTVQRTTERLFIDISDNGAGMPEETLIATRRKLKGLAPAEPAATDAARRHAHGIALENVNQRIRFYFGNEYGLDIESIPTLGTTVHIVLPRLTM